MRRFDLRITEGDDVNGGKDRRLILKPGQLSERSAGGVLEKDDEDEQDATRDGRDGEEIHRANAARTRGNVSPTLNANPRTAATVE
jgi:hypothetical protein